VLALRVVWASAPICSASRSRKRFSFLMIPVGRAGAEEGAQQNQVLMIPVGRAGAEEGVRHNKHLLKSPTSNTMLSTS
jgi:hypothetical protein